ncbi:MAG: prepilin peptidase [Alphaproteobacteria bacterium]|nr:prepilin peptidase [Alphaproteobacteria bacterium]
MTLQFHHLLLLVFVGLMLTAAFEDFRRLIIPNRVTLALCLLWPLYLAVAPGVGGIIGAIVCAAVVFIVGALGFSRGYVGGGDVKLLTVATLWAGPGGTPALLAVTGLIGGALALSLLNPIGAQLWHAAQACLGRASGRGVAERPTQVPYGIAIAAAALIITLPPHLS